MKGIFVTGTDTGVGKTVVTSLLARYLRDKGINVVTQKWVLSGAKSAKTTPRLPYTFKFASSPHLAAKLERKKISVEKIKKSYQLLEKNFDFVIVEGIGGALVPLNHKKLVIDIAKELKLPVVIVAANKLGAINHTLLTVEAIRRRGMNIIGIIFNNLSTKTNKIILKDNVEIIKKLTGEKILGVLPRIKAKDSLCQQFLPFLDTWISG